MVLLRIALTTLKHSFDPRLDEKLGDIFGLFEELKDKTKAIEYLEVLLRYLVNTRDITEEQIQKAVSQAYEEGGSIMTTLAERLRQQGMKQGVKNNMWTVVKNSLSKGLSIELIADITGMPVKKVEQMKAKIDQENLAPVPAPSGPSASGSEHRRL